MKYTKIEIKNYKSLGDTNCTLHFDTDIVGLVGKNQSGKSNIIKAISEFKVCDIQLNDKDFFNEFNKLTEKEIELDVEACVKGKEINSIFRTSFIEDEDFIFSVKVYKKNGVIKQAFNNTISNILYLKEINNLLDDLEHNINEIRNYEKQFNDVIPNNQIMNLANKELTILNAYSQYYQIMDTEFENEINRFTKKSKFTSINNNCSKILGLLNNIRKKISSRYALLSIIFNDVFYFEESTFEDVYKISSLDSFKNENNIIHKLLEISDISTDEIKEWSTKQEGYEKQDLEDKIIDKFNINFSEKFTQSYSQENIKIRLYLNGSTFCMHVKSNNKTMPLSDCSDGFIWYLNTYIELSYNNIDKVLMLLDEPATGVHIDFKKKILEQFSNIIKEGNQIVYTTHSPFMIDTNNLSRIQLVEKQNGITIINRNFYAGKTENLGESKLETLSPITKAIGFELKNSFEPDRNKCNIILEGITDYFYLNAMWDVLKLGEEKKPHFLPCIGANKEHLVATILLGWGYPFKALFDLDGEGIKESKEFKKIIVENINDIVFFNHICSCGKKLEDCECNKMIEDLFSSEDRKKFESVELSKTINAKNFERGIREGSLVVDEITKNNYKNLFNRLGLI